MSGDSEQWDRDDYGDEDSYEREYSDLESDEAVVKNEEDDFQSNLDNEDELISESTISEEDFTEDPELVNLDVSQPNEERITSPYLSKYERALILGKRAQQISHNSPLYIEIDETQSRILSPLDIAELQLLKGKIPFILRRNLPNGEFEDWKIEQLIQ